MGKKSTESQNQLALLRQMELSNGFIRTMVFFLNEDEAFGGQYEWLDIYLN